MTAEIINIGDELLIGQVVNTNGGYLAKQLETIGISVSRIVTIGDDRKTIVNAFRESRLRAEIVIATGGLGPTHDDVSKAAVAECFKRELVLDKATLTRVRARFAAAGYAKMPEVNIGQAMIPAGFRALKNDRGTAPGLLHQGDGRSFAILPGVPFEMEWITTNSLLRHLRRYHAASIREVIRHKTILTSGIGESLLAERLGDPNLWLPQGVTLAFLPSSKGVRLRLSTHSPSATAAGRALTSAEQHIAERALDFIYATDDKPLAEVVFEQLLANGMTLSTAESCTGGLIAAAITSVSGSSKVYHGSVIAYDNSVKKRELDVKARTLSRYGAVSEETAMAMAENCRARFKTTFALAVTGIAGPSGGSSEKPVGLVWIALAQKGKKTFAKRYRFGGDRDHNRERSVTAALDLLRITIAESTS